MDFALGETQQAVAAAAAHVLDRSPPAAGDTDDRALWKELGHAGLLGLALPGWLGGDGLGVMDTAVLLTEVGRRAAPVPALAALAMGVLPVTRWGDRDLQRVLLDGVAAGDAVLTTAVREPSDPMPPAPATTAGGGTVSGVKIGVPYAAAARWILASGQPHRGRHRRGRGRPVGGRGDAAAHSQFGGRARVHAAPGRGAHRPPAR